MQSCGVATEVSLSLRPFHIAATKQKWNELASLVHFVDVKNLREI